MTVFCSVQAERDSGLAYFASDAELQRTLGDRGVRRGDVVLDAALDAVSSDRAGDGGLTP